MFRADSDLYAVPATLGSITVAVLWSRGAFGAVPAAITAFGVLLLRLLAMRFHWRAPRARGIGDDPQSMPSSSGGG